MEEKVNLVVKEKLFCCPFDTKRPIYVTMFFRELAKDMTE